MKLSSSAVASRRSALTRPLVVQVIAAISLVVLPFAIDRDESPEAHPRSNVGAFEGGPTGGPADVGLNNVRQPGAPRRSKPSSLAGGAGAAGAEQRALGGGDIPTGGPPSPVFGAQSFTQPLLRFEEFGTRAMPEVYPENADSFPAPASASSVPDEAALEDFLAGPLAPEPTRLSNDRDENPWRPQIESFLGRQLDTPPAEGRPAGEMWAHQRWAEFPPQVYFQTAQAGARVNRGLRDDLQRHGYAVGEFAPGGLYHNTAGAPGLEGTTDGVQVRFHPDFPVQDPRAVWTFDGTFPPKLLNVRYGEGVLMRHYNALPISPSANYGFGLHTITTHEHNGHTPAESDGYTTAFFFPGQYYDYRWPIIMAGHDSVNRDASDPRCGRPDGSGGITNIPGDWRETMSTHWFHDHMLDFTAQNVYKGHAAMMNYYSSLDRGNEALDDGVNLRLPSGSALDWGNRDYDVNLVVADKAWDSQGQLWFNIFELDGFVGDRMTVNWLWDPYLEVRARRYRFRILNGSVSRHIAVGLIDQDGNPVPFHMVANDGNIMEHSVAMDGTLGTRRGELPSQGIAERYDIVVDFSDFQPGDRLYFVNLLEHDDGRGPKERISLSAVASGAYSPRIEDGEWEDGDPCVGRIMELRVREYDGVDLSMDPADYVRGGQKMIPVALRDVTQEQIDNALHRSFEFGRSSGTDSAPWTIKTDDGLGFGMDPRRISSATNNALGSDGLGNLEVWTIENGGGGWSHPIHIHFEEGHIIRRDGHAPPEWEQWARKDVYRVGRMDDSGDSVEILLRFREFAGTYMEHCHNTQHEDHAMLLRWDLENPGQTLLLPTPEPTWDGVEFVDSNALPTAYSGDGYGVDGVNAGAFLLGRFSPGTLGSVSTMSASGCTSGDLVGFLLSLSTGASSLSGSFCPNAIPLGIENPVLLGVDTATLTGQASVLSFVPRVLSGWTLHYQAVDVGGCMASNVISQTF